jgi:hypothetical protein
MLSPGRRAQRPFLSVLAHFCGATGASFLRTIK